MSAAPLDVWIDTDTAIGVPGADVDDGLALVQAFHSPELVVRGVSSVYGNAPLESTHPIAGRMRQANSFLSEDQAWHLTHHGTNQNEDGSYSWKFDNYVRAFSPYTFSRTDADELWSRIGCPTLLVRGTESWAGDPSQDGRVAGFQNAQTVNIDGAGHWVHHDRLDEFMRVVREFLAGD